LLLNKCKTKYIPVVIIIIMHDNVYGAIIMAKPLREFTRFIR